MATLIKNARIIDPRAQLDVCEDIYIDHERIEIAPSRLPPSSIIIRGRGMIVAPGLIDRYLYFPKSSSIHKEDINLGIRAARCGGVTSVLMMPASALVIDQDKTMSYLLKLGQTSGFDLMAAACARGDGKSLADVETLKRAGIKAFSNDNKHALDDHHMELLLRACRRNNTLFMQHRGLGHFIERDFRLAERIGARYHALYLSSKQSLALIRQAKRHSKLISCEVSPYHLLLCEREILTKNVGNMNSRRYSREDREALLEGLIDGTIDAVASGYALHAHCDREFSLHGAFPGAGVESSILALLTLVKYGVLSLSRAIALMTMGPAQLLGESERIGTMVGSLALKNICVLDPNFSQVFSRRRLCGPSKNNAFIGMQLYGRVMATFQNGHLVYKA